MVTPRSAGLLPIVLSALAVAGGVPFSQPRSGAGDPPPSRAKQGRLHGRFTVANTGKPVAGAKVRVLVHGVPGKAGLAEALSGDDGRYALDVPLGHCSLWGVSAPAGYYTQDPKTFGIILTTAAKPEVVRDFVLRSGSPWQVEVHGVTVPPDRPPYFSALPDPERRGFAAEEIISVSADARGQAVLTIPTASRKWRFQCGLLHSPGGYEITPIDLEIDKGFDPRQITGAPEALAEGKGVRLRDAAGRGAVVQGAEVTVEAGKAVLRFRTRRITSTSALVLRGSAVDEAGRPVEGAKFTAAFASGGGAAMSQLEATSNGQGKFELTDVLLPQSSFGPDSRISMIVVKAGLDGAQTKELSLLQIKKAGNGDFGTVVLKPGRTLRGKVVDENGRPVHGAIVTNLTNYFLYSHLRCRTDADGRFVMPDLSFGSQKLSAAYGERWGQEEFQFDAKSKECLIAVRLTPKSGTRQNTTARA